MICTSDKAALSAGTRKRLLLAFVPLLCVLVPLLGASSASAATPEALSPWWHMVAGARPSYLTRGQTDEIYLQAQNVGDAPIDGSKNPVVITDRLPAGLEAVAVRGATPWGSDNAGTVPCEVEESGSRVSCTSVGSAGGGVPAASALAAWEYIEVRIRVVVKASAASGEMNEASVTGGEAPSASISRPIVVGDGSTPFGLNDYELTPEESGGALDTQAGSHPFQLTTTLVLNQTADVKTPQEEEEDEYYLPETEPVALTKDLHFKLPPGLVGNPTPIPQCTTAEFLTKEPEIPGTGVSNPNECPSQTAIGVTRVTYWEPTFIGYSSETVPVFNLTPRAGEPARFGFFLPVARIPIYIDTSVRAGTDYGVTATVENIIQTAGFISSVLTFWGTPDDQRHNDLRGWECLHKTLGYQTSRFEHPSCAVPEVAHPPSFLELPTSCTAPMQTSVEADSYAEEGAFKPLSSSLALPALDGCNHLPFAPTIKSTPDSQNASSPTGLNVDVHVPQEESLNANGLAVSDVKDITVALPDGVAINPAGGDGLGACTADPSDQPETPGNEIGFKGIEEVPAEPGVSSPIFTPYLPGSIGAINAGDGALLQPGVNFCANASKIGEVTIHTPLLPNPLKGFVYLAAQEANPFGSIIAMYIVAEDPVSGSLVKLPGQVQLCQQAGEVIAGMTCQGLGQVISTFENNPQLPFEDAELHFFGGERAPLASPAHCGPYTTNASFAPWSGSAAVGATSTYDVTNGPKTLSEPGGRPCPGQSLPFSPSLTGGGLSVNAGWFSPFTATMTRKDGEQNLQSLEVKLPPGLSGILSNVELCPEPQANQGTCGPNSLIGETTVGVGVGGDPFSVRGGKFYLTGPYNGSGGCTVGEAGCAPFGITFEVPAKAGPYDFAKTKANHPACDCVLVRGKIEINPETAAVTITSNPPGTPDSIPTSIEGIPLEIQHVNATTTRADFQFNPTNCSKMAVTGTIHSSEGATDTFGVPFQVTNCAALKFTPKFAVSTSGKTSRAGGASLTAKVTEPSEPFGSQANISKVKVELPKQLPSRLTTLQKACTAAQFEANPAGCPTPSVIGHAKVITPLVPVPLEGPIYFVSHGGEAFPSVEIVLQGYGVKIVLVGATFISKTGITSTTFKTVPDQPFSTFELTLPEGKYSALAANGNLCHETKTVTVKKKETKRVHGKLKKVTVKVKKTEAEGLVIPNEFVGQNGAVIKQDTAISVTGCPKAKPAKKAKKEAKKHSKSKRGKKK
jgi:hypothetical protein